MFNIYITVKHIFLLKIKLGDNKKNTSGVLKISVHSKKLTAIQAVTWSNKTSITIETINTEIVSTKNRLIWLSNRTNLCKGKTITEY